MTRVLVLSDLWLPFPGGAERLIFNVARDLDRRDGFDVLALTGYAPCQRFDGPLVEAAPIEVRDARQDGWDRIAAVVARFEPDVIVTHHFYADQFENYLAACGVPVVQIVLNGRRLPAARLAVYISEHVRSTLGDAHDRDLTITPPAFADVAADTHGDAIGFIKPIRHKGVDLVYEIAGLMPERRFVILRGEWQGIEVTSDLPNVEYLEPVADIREFYRRVRLVLMPSVSEDAGTVAQECAVNLIPCVSSDVDGIRETNEGGWRIADRDPDVWAQAIRGLDDPAVYAAVTRRQREALAAADHMGKLEQFAARIIELGGAR